MQLVQPLLRLAVLLVAAPQARVAAEEDDFEPSAKYEPPHVAPRFDYSSYFGAGHGPGAAASAPSTGVGTGVGAGLAAGLGAGLAAKGTAAQTASAKQDTAGFVEPISFRSFFGGSGGGGASSGFGAFGGQQQQQASPFFGASAHSGSSLSGLSAFGAPSPASLSAFGPLSAVSSAEQSDFSDFGKAKRGTAGGLGFGGLRPTSASTSLGLHTRPSTTSSLGLVKSRPSAASSEVGVDGLDQTRDAGADDDFFRFDFDGDDGGGKGEYRDEDPYERDGADEEGDIDGDTAARPDEQGVAVEQVRAVPLRSEPAGNVRYPSYSSYYHTKPEQLKRGAEGGDADDDFRFDDDDDEDEDGRGAAAGLVENSSQEPSSRSAGSGEAYDSRPYPDTRGASTTTGAASALSKHTKPVAKLVSKPTKAAKTAKAAKAAKPAKGPSRFSLQGGFVPSPVDPLRTQASQPQAEPGAAAPSAAVHAAVRAAHRAAASGAAPGAAPGAAHGAAPGTVLALSSLEAGAGGMAGLGPTATYYVRRTREEPDDAFFESDDSDDERDSDDYRFSPDDFDDDEGGSDQGSDDEGQSAAASEVGDCKRVVKKGAVCMVCADASTGGNYEQCQYATEPEAQSYSFGRSSSYGSPKSTNKRRRRREERSRGTHRARRPQPRLDLQLDSSSQQDPVDAFGEPLKDSHEKDHEHIRDELDSSLEQLQGPKYDDYFSFLFPELSKEQAKKNGKRKRKKAHGGQDSDEAGSLLSRLDDEDPFAAETTSGVGAGQDQDIWLGPPESIGPPGEKGVANVLVPKKDLERMLGEFQQKDRSDCTKVEKDKMTCYQCVDKKGMQHEECMFVAASEPKQSHLAYHQSSAFKQPGPAAKGAPKQAVAASTNTASSKTAPATAAPPGPPSTAAPQAKAGAKSRQQRAADQKQAADQKPAANQEQAADNQQAKDDFDDDEDDEDDESEDFQVDDDEGEDDPEGPQGLGQGPDDGMFTEETRPVYDRALKMSLPKYMLERSEDERVFDEVLASGR